MATVVAFAFSGDDLLSGEFVLEPGLNVVYASTARARLASFAGFAQRSSASPRTWAAA